MSSICNGCHFLNDFLGWFNVILISRPLNSDNILEIRCIHPRNLSVCLIFGLVHLQLKSSELTRWLYKNRYHLLHRLSIQFLFCFPNNPENVLLLLRKMTVKWWNLQWNLSRKSKVIECLLNSIQSGPHGKYQTPWPRRNDQNLPFADMTFVNKSVIWRVYYNTPLKNLHSSVSILCVHYFHQAEICFLFIVHFKKSFHCVMTLSYGSI